MPSASSHPTLRQTLTGLLKGLAAAAIPGASLAEDAVNAVADRLDETRAWETLREELTRAEQAFLREADGRGWRDLAQAITQLPLHDLPALETALRLALAEGDPAPLQAELERQLARLPGVEHPRLAAEAARRYAAHILDAAWGLPAFRDAVRDVLFREQDRALRRLEESIQRLARWWRLVPAVQHLPREALLHEGDITLTALKAPLRVVPFTGKAHHALRDDLVRWALDLDQASYRAGVRVVYGPGGSGKTRIAVETVRELEKHGWRGFFIPSEILRQVQEAQVHVRGEARGWFTPLRPTLYILDYSESLPDATLQALLDTLYDTAGERAFPVALLLLRRPPPDEGLIQALAPATGEDAGRVAFRQQVVRPALTAPRPAPRMEDRDDLLTLFLAAREAFVDLRGRMPEAEVTYRPEDLPDRALAVVLLGLLAAYGHRVVQSPQEQNVFADVWRWERSKWARTLEKARAFREDEEKAEALARVEQAQVAATLGRPFFRGEDLVAFWKQVDAAGLLDDRDLRRLVRHLPRIFPRAGEDAPLVPPIAPDPLADWIILRNLEWVVSYMESALKGMRDMELFQANLVLRRCLVKEEINPEDRVILTDICAKIDSLLPENLINKVLQNLLPYTEGNPLRIRYLLWPLVSSGKLSSILFAFYAEKYSSGEFIPIAFD